MLGCNHSDEFVHTFMIFDRWFAGSARKKQPRSNTMYTVVVDSGNGVVITISRHRQALMLLQRSMMDTGIATDVTLNDVLQRVLNAGPRSYPEASWDIGLKKFVATNPDQITERMRETSILASKKAWAYSKIIYWINHWRARSDYGFLFQPAIYAEKARQARLLQDSQYDGTRTDEAFYVTQYAETRGISEQQAAEEILLQAQLHHETLARTERNRLTLLETVRHATSIAEIDNAIRTYIGTRAI
jgi:hypothetical protein